VVSVAGSVNGSPLADDAPESLLTLLEYLPGSECGAGDGGAVNSMKPSTRRDFARTHELPERVRYYSLASFAQREQISFGLRGGYDDLAKIDPRNDSQLLFYDQIIAGGVLLGFVNADHWAVALPIARARPALAATLVDRNEFPREVLLEAIVRHVEEELLAMPRGFGARRDFPSLASARLSWTEPGRPLVHSPQAEARPERLMRSPPVCPAQRCVGLASSSRPASCCWRSRSSQTARLRAGAGTIEYKPYTERETQAQGDST
jgi:hypothetical protein